MDDEAEDDDDEGDSEDGDSEDEDDAGLGLDGRVSPADPSQDPSLILRRPFFPARTLAPLGIASLRRDGRVS